MLRGGGVDEDRGGGGVMRDEWKDSPEELSVLDT